MKLTKYISYVLVLVAFAGVGFASLASAEEGPVLSVTDETAVSISVESVVAPSDAPKPTLSVSSVDEICNLPLLSPTPTRGCHNNSVVDNGGNDNSGGTTGGNIIPIFSFGFSVKIT